MTDNEMTFKNIDYIARIDTARVDAKKRIVLDNTVNGAILEGKKVFVLVVDGEVANGE